MGRIGTAELVLPKHFRDALQRHLDHHGQRTKNESRNVSRETLARRRAILMLIFAELYQLGFRLQSPDSLGDRHVCALMAHWIKREKKPATIQNNLSVLRMFAGWIKKPGMVKSTLSYVDDPSKVKRSVVATQNKSWAAAGVNPIGLIALARQESPRAALYLQLMHAFGLRLKEAICLKPLRDIVMNEQWLSVRDGTKGGRQRMVPVENDYQRETLDLARAMADQKKGIITPRDLTLKQAYNQARYQLRKLGITKDELGITAHGLRHQYLQESYESITGRLTPIQGGKANDITFAEHKQACLEVMGRAGHGRVDVGGSYYGSFGHSLRQNASNGANNNRSTAVEQGVESQWTDIHTTTPGSRELTAAARNGAHIAKPRVSYAAISLQQSMAVRMGPNVSSGNG